MGSVSLTTYNLLSPRLRVPDAQSVGPNVLPKGCERYPVHQSMGRMVYLPTWMIDLYGFHVGKHIPY